MELYVAEKSVLLLWLNKFAYIHRDHVEVIFIIVLKLDFVLLHLSISINRIVSTNPILLLGYEMNEQMMDGGKQKQWPKNNGWGENGGNKCMYIIKGWRWEWKDELELE